ncbi:MAG: group I truncated hemoglobin [Elstera sp.]
MKRFLLIACVCAALATPVSAASLFEDLGGQTGLTKITNDMVDIALADPRIKDSFAETNIPRLRDLLYQHFCELTGGPCTYKGRDMVKSHAPLKLRDLHFNALAEDLEIAMERSNIPWSVQARFLAILAPMRPEIVTR